jgi:hypothetical protein
MTSVNTAASGSGAPWHGLRTALVASLLAALVLSFQAATTPAAAQADYCDPYPGEGWYCYMAEINLAPNTPRWFSLSNNLRNWFFGKVSDAYGGTVTQKCIHIMRASDGYKEQVACGSGAPGGGVNWYMKPGYMFIRHGASGPRTLGGLGISPYPI